MIYHSKEESNNEKLGRVKRSSFNFINIHTLVLLLWTVFILAFYLLSGRFWFWNLFSFIPPFFLLFVSLFFFIYSTIKLIVIKRDFKRLSLLFFLSLFIVLITAPISDFKFTLLAKQQIQGDIRIFNLNTEFWEEEQDIDDFIEFLKNQDADIYHLQEYIARSDKNMHDKESISKTFEKLVEAFPDFEIVRSSELITMSKFPVFAKFENPDNKFLRVDIWIDEKIVSFYNVHIPVHIDPGLRSNLSVFLNDIERRFYWRQDIFSFISNELEFNNRPKIVSGDFNTTKTMFSMDKILDSVNDSVKELNINFATSWRINDLALWRIDYVLGDNYIDFKSYETIDAKEFSDHLGQKVTFNLKGI